MSDKAFYDIWEKQDQPYDEDQMAVLDNARELGKAFPINKKVYIVRGLDLFVIHSSEISVTKNQDGTRRIVVERGEMVKYADGSKRIVD